MHATLESTLSQQVQAKGIIEVTGVQAEFLIKRGKGLKALSLQIVVIYFFTLKHFPKIPQWEHCTYKYK